MNFEEITTSHFKVTRGGAVRSPYATCETSEKEKNFTSSILQVISKLKQSKVVRGHGISDTFNTYQTDISYW